MSRKQLALLEPTLVRQALLDAVKKLSPMVQWRNPVMFIVWVGSLLTTLLAIAMAGGALTGSATFTAAVSIWLWFTVLFANFAEAMAEGRSKAQANSLKGVKKTAFARKLRAPQHDATVDHVPAEDLRKGDVVLVEAGDIIPCDGEVIEGGASVDESAITGESAPVIRESGGDFASVTGGTRILSDWLVIRCSVNPGETFLDRMIAMVEGAQRRKTPNEIALTILLIALTLVFLLATATIWPFSAWSGNAVSVTVLVALLVCLIPTTIGGLLSAIGVAGMSRMLGANVIATSGRAVETSMSCCWIKPGPLPSATVRLPPSCRLAAWKSEPSPTPPSSPRWRMKPLRGAASWCWRNSALICANAICSRCTPPLSPLPRKRG